MNISSPLILKHKEKIKLLFYLMVYFTFAFLVSYILYILVGIAYLSLALKQGRLIDTYSGGALSPFVRIIVLLVGIGTSYFLSHFLLRKLLVAKCNICSWRGERFQDFDCGYGHIYKNSTCPDCFSQPRHRSFFLYLKRVIPKDKKLKVLHFAPENFLTKLFKSYKLIEYLSVDLDPEKAMQKEDITKLSFADNSYDIIFCSHVLEHVENDKKAIMELYRVLKPGGFAVIDVPIDYGREKTYEDVSIKLPDERTRAFWQWDHVRLYAKDFPDKLRSAGFEVKADKFISYLKKSKIKYFGLQADPIYFCQKR